MNRKIAEIAGILFALGFIFLMAVIFGNVMKFGGEANNRIETIREAVIQADLEQYNNSVVSGDTVISLINKMKKTQNGLKMSYAVCNGTESSSAGWKYYGYQALKFKSDAPGYITSGSTAAGYKVYDVSLRSGSADYISPVKEYKANIVANANGIIVGIKFVMQ